MRCSPFLALVFFFIFSLSCGLFNVRAEESFPLPDDAVRLDGKDLSTNQMPLTISRYKSETPVSLLSAFFLKEMKKAGWEGEKQKDGALMFKKAGEMVFIVLIPPRRPGSPTQFTVTRGVPPTEKQLLATQKDKPDTLNFMPPYPGAKQSFLMDMPGGGVSAGYSVNDTFQNVLFFYKAKMLNCGWVLARETPVEEKPLDCPECKKKAQEQMTLGGQKVSLPELKGVMKHATLFFQRKKGESCVINLVSQRLDNPPEELKDMESNPTTITVTYNETNLPR